MRIMNYKSLFRWCRNSARPVRKLAAATRAVFESFEHRVLMSTTSLTTTSLGGSSSGSSVTTATTTSLGVTALSLYQANSNIKLQSLANNATIDLADYADTDLNIRATTFGTVGSVQFGVNGDSNARVENLSSYDLAGTGGIWRPSVGTYTITATAYTDKNATGSDGTSVTITFKVIDTSGSSTNNNNPPPPTNRPSFDNTGPAAGTKFTSVGGFKGQSNTTYSNLRITGVVTLTGLTNVTLVNCIIDGNGAGWAVRCDNASNITVKNCEIFNVASAAIYGHGFNAINNTVYQSGGDGFKPLGNCLIQGNYVTQLGWNQPNAHADGVQIRGGSDIQIIGNYFDMPIDVANTKSNTSLFLQMDVKDVTFSNNWLRGGNYNLHVFSDLAGGNETIDITNNVYYAKSAQFGFAQCGDGVVMDGNVTDAGVLATTSTK